MNVTVDESMYFKNKIDYVAKGISEVYREQQRKMDNEYHNHRSNPDPFLLSDSKVMTGQGKAIVCCVGDNTLLARNKKPKDLVIEE